MARTAQPQAIAVAAIPSGDAEPLLQIRMVIEWSYCSYDRAPTDT